MPKKLIRDKLVSILCKKEGNIVRRVMDKQEHLRLLKEKLVEEALEVRSSEGRKIIEEIADVKEVIEAIIKELGVEKEVEEVKKQKLRTRGGFSRGWVLEEK